MWQYRVQRTVLSEEHCVSVECWVQRTVCVGAGYRELYGDQSVGCSYQCKTSSVLRSQSWDRTPLREYAGLCVPNSQHTPTVLYAGLCVLDSEHMARNCSPYMGGTNVVLVDPLMSIM